MAAASSSRGLLRAARPTRKVMKEAKAIMASRSNYFWPANSACLTSSCHARPGSCWRGIIEARGGGIALPPATARQGKEKWRQRRWLINARQLAASSASRHLFAVARTLAVACPHHRGAAPVRGEQAIAHLVEAEGGSGIERRGNRRESLRRGHRRPLHAARIFGQACHHAASCIASKACLQRPEIERRQNRARALYM